MPSLASSRIKMAWQKAAFTSILVALAACSPQGNGDRCDPFAGNGGDNDCGNDPDLSCVSVGAPAGTEVFACCPNANSNATKQGLCAVKSGQNFDAATPATDGAAPEGDAGDDAEGGDASGDAATAADGSVDGGVDAAADSAATG